MGKITVKFPDGSSSSFSKNTTLFQIVKSVDDGSGKDYIAGKVNEKLVDMSSPLLEDANLEFITPDSEMGLDIIRHSASHVMAQAVKKLYKGVKITIGPTIDNGFYYDFDYGENFSPHDLAKIESKMQEIIGQDLPITRKEIPKEEAIEMFKNQGETYKVELLEEISDEFVSVYIQDDFIDLCRGPHLPSTGKIRAFKLTNLAGAYWRGDEKNKMLQRIYGTAFSDTKTLEDYLQRLEDAKRRDHRKLGKSLDLFSIHEDAGAGLVIYHPKGAMLRSILEDFEKREHLKRGYQLVRGPHLLKLDLWEKSGHFENYRENMYFTEIEGQKYGIKPMNCLAHMLIYKSKIRSYRDLPQRYFELGTVHRHEKSGVLHGLFRVREFTQDDAHILCTPDQLEQEIKGVIDFVEDVMKIFKFEYEMELSTRPEKSIGNDLDWEKATLILGQVMDKNRIPYIVKEGEGAFYGPKIDVKLKDALDRKWQCATIQCDFVLPERFDLTFINSNGTRERPVMLHRVILGAMERFIGILIEHYGGAFPTWLAPVQAIVLTVTDRNMGFAEEVYNQLTSGLLRIEKDFRNEKLGLKIREAQLQKIPYMLIIGDKEVNDGVISARVRSGEKLKPMKINEFISLVQEECQNRG
ncbi:MAG: threonine--tRNA ligase [Deltaproteobacteria bacterium CG12_big_fil_rev_8_21_14_0_65_43_10]|nr:MAG: threonine--tRNA ligase [Deltaproteobacteria bacterium CG2_30_43_15]PIQ45687.1 MAG: threonine--tRNA ligase [Deltaproteobacteria bacterium CG12_big_fil_rev_8_21_14_0_65_43_10]PIX26057.1 MAG: threonine--tRNA ligase [Deltaproteobacteria bacterium CG_4_8_14_3_um_filter_43_13]HCX90282.1 threonine--tRNA ligase [Deltaproteobacteria bacterium]